MEGRKSFVDEFFPRNEATKPTRYDILNTILSPRPTGAGKDSAQSEWSGSWKKSGVEGKIQSTSKKNDKPVNHYELPESYPMSSSVYYGGRDDFIPQTAAHNSGAHYSYKKNKEEDSGNSEVATRGDWWQGSFYY